MKKQEGASFYFAVFKQKKMLIIVFLKIDKPKTCQDFIRQVRQINLNRFEIKCAENTQKTIINIF